MESETYYNDERRAAELFSDDDLWVINEAVPSLTYSNIKLIRKYYKETVPSFGELRTLAALLDIRRKQTDGALIGTLATDSIALLATYADIREKQKALTKKESASLTLDEAAEVLSAYMRSIGRYDACAFSSTDAKPDALTVDADGKHIVSFGGKKAKKNSSAEFITDRLAVVLVDARADELRRLLSDRRARALYRGGVKIGEFGIIGTLADRCGGVRADISRLAKGVPASRILCGEYIGKYLVFVAPSKASGLCAIAAELGISSVFFALTDDSGLFRTKGASTPIELLRLLTDSRRTLPALVSECDLSCKYTSLPLSAKKGEAVYDACGAIIKSGGRLIAPVRISPDDSSFGAAVSAMTDSVLRLAAAGIDRRALCSALLYEFQENDTTPEGLGEALSLILGAYRVGVELAISDGVTRVEYGERRELVAVLYAEAPRKPLSASVAREDSALCFLPIASGDDGLCDFSSLRRVCDEFSALHIKGHVLSSAAVTGSLDAALRSMGERGSIELTSYGRALSGHSVRGILFETDDTSRTDIIAKTLKI